MKLIIRRYKLLDYSVVFNLHNIALRAIGAHIGSGKWDDDLQNIEVIYLQSGGEFLVGIVDECVIAMGALRKLSDTRAEIKRVRVAPRFQGRGYGQTMIESLEKRATELGFFELQLDTMLTQIAARKLYEKNGQPGRECNEFQSPQPPGP